jgi:hypothetical protein
MIIRNLKHLQVLSVQLEAEDNIARPTKFGVKFDPQPWNVKPSNITLTLEDMKAKRSNLSKMSCWVLRKAIKGVSSSQNADRDFTTIAQAAKVEELLVSKYRKRLLTESDSAFWLRQELERISVQGQRVNKETYDFPDGMATAEMMEAEPHVELTTIVEATKVDRLYREEKNNVAKLMSRIRDAGVSEAMPWTKLQMKVMVAKLNEVERVSE